MTYKQWEKLQKASDVLTKRQDQLKSLTEQVSIEENLLREAIMRWKNNAQSLVTEIEDVTRALNTADREVEVIRTESKWQSGTTSLTVSAEKLLRLSSALKSETATLWDNCSDMASKIIPHATITQPTPLVVPYPPPQPQQLAATPLPLPLKPEQVPQQQPNNQRNKRNNKKNKRNVNVFAPNLAKLNPPQEATNRARISAAFPKSFTGKVPTGPQGSSLSDILSPFAQPYAPPVSTPTTLPTEVCNTNPKFVLTTAPEPLQQQKCSPNLSTAEELSKTREDISKTLWPLLVGRRVELTERDSATVYEGHFNSRTNGVIELTQAMVKGSRQPGRTTFKIQENSIQHMHSVDDDSYLDIFNIGSDTASLSTTLSNLSFGTMKNLSFGSSESSETSTTPGAITPPSASTPSGRASNDHTFENAFTLF